MAGSRTRKPSQGEAQGPPPALQRLSKGTGKAARLECEPCATRRRRSIDRKVAFPETGPLPDGEPPRNIWLRGPRVPTASSRDATKSTLGCRPVSPHLAHQARKRGEVLPAHFPYHHLRQRLDELRRVVQRRHHFKLPDAESPRRFARLDVNFTQRLDVVADEGDGHDENALSAGRGESVKDIIQ